MIEWKCYVCHKICISINKYSRHILKLHQMCSLVEIKLIEIDFLQTYIKFTCGYTWWQICHESENVSLEVFNSFKVSCTKVAVIVALGLPWIGLTSSARFLLWGTGVYQTDGGVKITSGVSGTKVYI